MKDLIDIIFDEEKSFNFPLWVYAIVMPLCLFAIMAFAGWLETISGLWYTIAVQIVATGSGIVLLHLHG